MLETIVGETSWKLIDNVIHHRTKLTRQITCQRLNIEKYWEGVIGGIKKVIERERDRYTYMKIERYKERERERRDMIYVDTYEKE